MLVCSEDDNGKEEEDISPKKESKRFVWNHGSRFFFIIALSHWCKAMHPVVILAGNNEVGNFNNLVDSFNLFVLCEKNEILFPSSYEWKQRPWKWRLKIENLKHENEDPWTWKRCFRYLETSVRKWTWFRKLIFFSWSIY